MIDIDVNNINCHKKCNICIPILVRGTGLLIFKNKREMETLR